MPVAFASQTNWLGQSSNWFEESNWSNGVPDALTDAVIGSGGTSSPIISSGEARVRHLRINQALTISQGGQLEADGILVDIGGQPDIVVTDAGTRIVVSGDMLWGGTITTSNSSDIGIFRISNGASVQVEGTLKLGDPGLDPGVPFRVVNFELSGNDSLLEVGNLVLAAQANNFINWWEGTIRVAGTVTVGEGEGSILRQFGLRLSPRTGLAGASLLDLTADDPSITLLREMEFNQIRFDVEDAEYRLESAAGVPISLRGGFDVLDRSPGHIVANGHHEVNVWRIEQGTAEFNGSVDGLVEVLPGRTLTADAEITRLDNQGIVQIGATNMPGTLTIGEEYAQTSSGSTRIRVTATGTDQLVTPGSLAFDGGDIRILIDQDAEPGTYALIETALGFAPFNAAVEIINQSGLRAETTVTANLLRLELRRTGALAVDADELDFGPVTLGESTEQTLVLSNSGESDLQVNLQSLTEPAYGLIGGSCPLQFVFFLPPDQSCSVMIRFEPDRAGEINDSLTVLLPGEDGSQSIDLRGLGVAGPDIFSDRFERF